MGDIKTVGGLLFSGPFLDIGEEIDDHPPSGSSMTTARNTAMAKVKKAAFPGESQKSKECAASAPDEADGSITTRAKQAILETNARMDSLIQAIPDIIYFKDPDRRNRVINRAFEEAFGLSPGQILGKTDEEILPPGLAAACRKSDDIVFESGKKFRFDEETRSPEGKAIHFETIKAPIFDEAGRVSGLVGITRDITERKNAEASLRESEERFRSLYENSTLGLYRTTPEGCILLANPTIVRMLGYESLDELINRNLEQEGFEAGYSRTAFRDRLEREGEIRGLEAVWKRKDGTSIHVRESARAIRARDGSVLCYEGTVEDVSERHKFEAALRASEEKYRGLFEKSLDGIYQSLPQGRFITVNPALVRMFGFRNELDMCQADIRDLYLNPDDRDNWVKEIREKGEIRNLEVRLKRKDGTPFTALETSRAVFDARGEVLYCEGLFSDITERKRLEDERAESEALYRALFENANDAVFLLDLNGIHVKVNRKASEMTGYSVEELIGKSIRNLVAPSEFPDAQDKLRGIVEGRTFPVYERLFRKKDGTEIQVEVNASLIRDADRKPRFIQSIVRDISERKIRERALQAALQEKELLLREIHHRVKNNMQVVSSLLNMQSRYINDPRDAEAFREGQRRIRSMALVHEKLYRSRSLSRIEFGGYLRQLSGQMLQSSDKRPGTISLKLDMDERMFDIQTAIPLGLITNELLSNSLKHAFPDERRGEITISLRPGEGGEFILVFSDDGVGLPPDFNPLRSESMGFQLVSMLVEQLDGRLEIERGRGTQVRIFFRETASGSKI
ncbi:MAG: PAS domain S-box protein [Candidatus Aminicenantes bacterium]|nr:PAS domain S-box protein [Candidatus Aminicenantes bacterium]